MIKLTKLKNKLISESSLISRKISKTEDINNNYLISLLDNIIGFSNREDKEEYDLVKFQDSLIKSGKINNNFIFIKNNTLVLDLDIYKNNGFKGFDGEIYINFSKLLSFNKNIDKLLIRGNLGDKSVTEIMDIDFNGEVLSDFKNESGKGFIIEYDNKKGNNNRDDILYIPNFTKISPNINFINISNNIYFKSDLTGKYRLMFEDPKKNIMNRGIRLQIFDTVLDLDDLKKLYDIFIKSNLNNYDEYDISKIINNFKYSETPLSYYFDYPEFVDYLLQYKGSRIFQNGHPYSNFSRKSKTNEMFIRLDKESEVSYYINRYSKYYKNHKVLYHSKRKNENSKRGVIIYFF